MKRGSAQAGGRPRQSGTLQLCENRSVPPSVPLLKAENHQNKGKTTANTSCFG